MFVQIQKLLPKGSLVVMTVSMITDGIMRVTLQPTYSDNSEGGSANKPKLKAIVLEGKPEELDDPGIDFTPMADVAVSLNDAIKEAAAASKVAAKATIKPESDKPDPGAVGGTAAAAAKTTGRKGKGPVATGTTSEPVAPVVPTEPAESPEAKAAREKAEADEKAESERKAAEAAAKKKAEEEAAARKAAKQAQIDKLQRELEEAEKEQDKLGL